MNHQEHLDYWENEIRLIEERCDLNGLLKQEKKNKVVLNQYDHVKEPKASTLLIRDGVYRNLKQICREKGFTLNSILQFVWHKTLSVYGNSSQTVIGTTVSGRDLPVDDIENSVGLFINTLPLIVNHNAGNLIVDAMKNIQDKINDIVSRSNVDLSHLSKGVMKHGLFDSLFVYENYPNLKNDADQTKDKMKFEKKYDVEKVDYPLAVIAHETVNDECLTFAIKYAGELFEENTISELLDLVHELLLQIGNGQVTQVADLKFLTKKQSDQINAWNSTDNDFPSDNRETTLHQLFEEEVMKSPDRVAVVFEDVQLTYRELNERANQLAHYLRSVCDIRPDDLIALLLDKSELMIISILGVWKSGAAYVPIDPSYPDERVQFILHDTGAKVIITNQKYMKTLDPYNLIKVEINSVFGSMSNGHSRENVPSISSSSSLAYVTYTSGTSGVPKGVMKEHHSVINVIIDLTEKYNLSSCRQHFEMVLLLSQYVFEPFIRQCLMALLNSQTLLIILQEGIYDSTEFDRLSSQHKISYVNGTASVLQGFDFSKCKSLKRLIFAGEELTENCFKKLRNSYKGIIINEYGPTECALVSTMKKFGSDESRINRSIGKPLRNVKCYVLDRNLNQLPIGAMGELHIGGIGVARGYLNRPELTSERFLPNPYRTEEEKESGKNARIYKTGDLVRWLPNGELEYLGRNDFQVKIRGLRIELGEIETVLSSYQGVKRCVVLAKDHKNKNTDTSSTKYLVGYYVSDSDLVESDMKEFMQAKLPSYMIPHRLVHIAMIPVTINGKLDARALPDIQFSADEKNYVVPRNELEVKLCQLWSDLLCIEKIGITDDFFRLGGDSISCLQIVGRIRKDLGVSVSVKDIFLLKTIQNLFDNKLSEQFAQSNDVDQCSNFLDGTKSTEEPCSISLLPMQRYLLENKNSSPSYPSQCILLRIAHFDLNKFQDCLTKLVDRHEAFRITWGTSRSEKYFQHHEADAKSSDVKLVQVSKSDWIEMYSSNGASVSLIKQLAIENGLTYMVDYSDNHGDDGSAKVWIFMDRLIIDWRSFQIISEELHRFYTDSNLHNSSNHRYIPWLNTVNRHISKIGASEEKYWRSFLSTDVKIFNETLLVKQQQNNDVSETKITLTEKMNKSLLDGYNKTYNTQIQHLLLTALGYTLRNEITDLNDNYVMFEDCCRDFASHLDVSRTVGIFRTMYPVRLQLANGADNLHNSIINIKEHLEQVAHMGLGFGAIMNCEHHNFPLVSFNYLGQISSENNANSHADQWRLLDGFCENSMNENTRAIVQINVFIIREEMRLSIRTKLGVKMTDQFARGFRLNIERVIRHVTLMNRSYLTGSDVDYVIRNNRLSEIQFEKEVDAIFIANSLQQGLLYHSLKQSNEDDAYIVQSIFQYRTEINQEQLRMAWTHAQKTFDTLRLRFDWQDELIQVIDKEQSLDWRFTDLTAPGGNVSNQASQIKQIEVEDRNERFDLKRGNLFRVYLIQQQTDSFVLIFTFHHIILDGWSLPILFDYVHQNYLKLIQSNIPSPSLPSGSSSQNEGYRKAQKYLQEHRQEHLDYWENEIRLIEERCDLNGLLKQEKKNKVVLNQYDHVKEPKASTLLIRDGVYRNLKQICREKGFTLNSILQFVWHKTLSVYGNSSQTVIGTTVSGRDLPVDDIENSVGLFINTLPLIVNHNAGNLIVDAMKNIQDKINDIVSRSNVDLSHLSKGVMKHGLFDSLFVYENYPNLKNDADQTKDKMKFEKKYDVEKVDYPLAVIAHETVNDECLTFAIKYAGELFEENTISELLDLVHELLLQIGNGQVTQVADLKFLTKKQSDQINAWNSTDNDFPSDNRETTLHQLFEEEVMKSPDRVAVVFEDVQLTYRELNERANQLAHYLRSVCDIRPDDLIALLLDKSELMIISILGVWKSGAAYVPIDPSYPDERVQFILHDTGAKVIITNQKYMKTLDPYNLIKVEIDGSLVADVFSEETTKLNPVCITNTHNLAYVIYTSGTTGKPKGVMIEHVGVINLKIALTELFQLKSRAESVLSFSNYVFDHFVEQMTYALLNSHVLVVLNDEMRADKVRLYQYMKSNKVTYLSGTPSVLQEYDYEQLNHLIRIDAVGEDFGEVIFNKIRSSFHGLIINGYGPTEISITSHKKLYYVAEKRIDKSIGKQIPSTACYVLDRNLNQLPIGAMGELHIGGIGVARGYLNRPELTSERFLPNPYRTEEEKESGKNARIYKTGDLVRWLPNGELEYLGRNDFQVKIRGLRIELGEIETVLSSYQGVKRCVVLAKDHKNKNTDTSSTKYLVGYYVSDSDLVESDMKEFMQAKLPSYMIPHRLVNIAMIPVTISGKLDARALPEENFTLHDQRETEPPRNELEGKIAQIWSQTLGMRVQSIGIRDDFFSLGGDSIQVIKLSILLAQSLSVNFSVPAIFRNKTIAKQALHILHGHGDGAGQNHQISRLDDKHGSHPTYPLSLAQERLLFINEVAGEDIGHAYNIPIFIKFSGINIRRELLYQSLLAVICRHEILRTLIREDESGIISQHVLDETEANALLTAPEIHVANSDQLDAELVKSAEYVFNLREELPIKVKFYEIPNEDRSNHTTLYMTIVMHHICFDGWSWSIFLRDLQIFYDFYEKKTGKSPSDTSSSLALNLPRLQVQYKDFAAWQRKDLTGKKLDMLSEFWRNRLDGFEPLNLITDCPIRPSKYDYNGDEITFELDEQTTTALKQLAIQLNVSLFSLLLSAYTLMLSNFTNQQDIVIGTPVANRNQPELENLIGFFVNILVLRITVDAQIQAMDYIRQVSNEVINAQIHQEMPFERLVKELHIANDPSRHPIVQVMFIMNHQFEVKVPAGTITEPAKLIQLSQYIPSQTALKTAKYDISTSIDESATSLKGHFSYATTLFREKTIQSLKQSFLHILKRFLQLNETSKIQDIDCIDSVQHDQINAWNSTDNDFPSDNRETTLHQLFEEEVMKSPDRVAVVFEDVQLTYRELNERANQLAHYLRSVCDIRPDDLIALLLDKSELMIISILGVWKSGAAYVPIDPSYPDERVQFILHDTGAKVIITNQKYMKTLDPYNLIKVEIDGSLVADVFSEETTKLNPVCITNTHNLAYVIYTSGTTGKPKGVLIVHEGVVSFRNDIVSRYFGYKDIGGTPQAVLLFSNYVFDFSVEQFVLSILNSKTLIILGNSLTIDNKFYSYLNENRLTYLSGTPTQLQQIDLKELKYLETLTIAGEALTERLFEKIRQEYKGRIINAYGVTETTVYNMVYVYENDMEYKNSIGTLLSNTKRFVLSTNMQILPVCAVGSLYLTGDCMSRGYLNRPELTSERFLPNPYRTEEEKESGKNARIYKTGDLVRWLPNGELEYLGRNDFQVKIRGLRIELGEIETVLSSYQGVKRCVVLAKDHKNKNTDTSSTKYLVGYYVSDSDLVESDMKEFMQAKLPSYMIPHRLVHIAMIPVTINGKLDARALPDIQFSADEKNYVVPRNELEVKLCQLWSDLLCIEKIGITDDFFRLGGDSISCLQIVGRIRKDLGVSVSVKDIFLLTTIERLYDNVLKNSAQQKVVNMSEQGTLSGEVPLLPIQKWFFAKDPIPPNHWNQAFLIETPYLDPQKLSDSLIKLIEHHDAFKLRFKQTDHKNYIQYYNSAKQTEDLIVFNCLDIHSLDLNENKDQALREILTKWQSQFDIERGPLFAVGYLTGYADGKARIWFAMHHLIVDAVSWRILCEDLQRLYNGAPCLGKKCSSYRQWSQVVQSYAIRNSLTEGIYWHNILSDVRHFNEDLVKCNTFSGNKAAASANIALTTIQTANLLRDCPHAFNAQINVLLLTALGYALRELTRNRINCVTLEGHGREDIDDHNVDISRTVGWFTTMYPIILEIDNDLSHSIINVKKHLMQVPNKGIGYGSIIGYQDRGLPQVSFNYLGQFETASSIKPSGSGSNAGWYLTDGVVGDELVKDRTEATDNEDVIAVNGRCMKGQLRFNIHSRLNFERTKQFADSFKSNLEEIIRECFDTKMPNSIDYSNDFEHPFVEFNESCDYTLFILPPGEGGAESYFKNIVPYLSSYKLIIFNNYYLDLKAKNMEKGFSFEKLAHLYIKYIKQIQRKGPYNLLGWSFGGVLSFEIARQLNNAGDEIQNIFMIDSYFNVSKASLEIGKMDNEHIIDPINYSYSPKIEKEAFESNLAYVKINVVLFKANMPSEGYLSDGQSELFTYYTSTKFNNLDTVINHKYIRVLEMHDDCHFSWVFNHKQISTICNYVASVFKNRQIE